MTQKSNITDDIATIHGFYYDPFHGGCHRYIDGFGNIIGTYGTDEKQSGKLYSNQIVYCNPHDFTHSKIAMKRIKEHKEQNEQNKPFTFTNFLKKIDNNKGRFLCLVVDFKEKTHVDHDRYYIALFHRRTKQIHWEDGNTWYFGCYQTSSPFDFFFHVSNFPITKFISSGVEKKKSSSSRSSYSRSKKTKKNRVSSKKTKKNRVSSSKSSSYIPYVSLKKNRRKKKKTKNMIERIF